MFGGVGVGKSSFLNTLVTALANTPGHVFRSYSTAPSRTGKSKTKTVGYNVVRFMIIPFICF